MAFSEKNCQFCLAWANASVLWLQYILQVMLNDLTRAYSRKPIDLQEHIPDNPPKPTQFCRSPKQLATPITEADICREGGVDPGGDQPGWYKAGRLDYPALCIYIYMYLYIYGLSCFWMFGNTLNTWKHKQTCFLLVQLLTSFTSWIVMVCWQHGGVFIPSDGIWIFLLVNVHANDWCHC